MAVGDYFLSTSVVTSGNNFQKISLIARCMNLNMVPKASFFRVQKHYTLPVIRDFWKEILMKNIERAKAQMSPLIVKGMKDVLSLNSIYQFCKDKGILRSDQQFEKE